MTDLEGDRLARLLGALEGITSACELMEPHMETIDSPETLMSIRGQINDAVNALKAVAGTCQTRTIELVEGNDASAYVVKSRMTKKWDHHKVATSIVSRIVVNEDGEITCDPNHVEAMRQVAHEIAECLNTSSEWGITKLREWGVPIRPGFEFEWKVGSKYIDIKEQP
jgi:hypothetical protein